MTANTVNNTGANKHRLTPAEKEKLRKEKFVAKPGDFLVRKLRELEESGAQKKGKLNL